MRICLASRWYPPETIAGGIATQTWNKARALSRAGHEVHVICGGRQPQTTVQTEQANGVAVHRLPRLDRQFPVYEDMAYWLGYTWQVYDFLAVQHQQMSFDVVDFADYGAEGFACLLDRTPWNWLPVVVQLHAPLSLLVERLHWPLADSPLARFGIPLEEFCIQQADALMACSANIADFVSAKHKIERDRITVVHCGVDAETFSPPPTRPAAEPPVVLFVGNLAESKGLQTIVDGVLEIRSRYPEIILEVAGHSTSLLERIEKQCAAAGAGRNFRYLGFLSRDQLPACYRRATVFASPAHHEGGVANVYLEAMACGCPVIASNSGGAPEAVTDGVTGWIIPPDDVAATVDALDKVLGDRSLAAQMGQAARARVLEHFAMPRYVDRILACYEEARQRKPQPSSPPKSPET